MSNPGLMSELMNSPMMQEMLRNPEIIRQSMMANPQIR